MLPGLKRSKANKDSAPPKRKKVALTRTEWFQNNKPNQLVSYFRQQSDFINSVTEDCIRLLKENCNNIVNICIVVDVLQSVVKTNHLAFVVIGKYRNIPSNVHARCGHAFVSTEHYLWRLKSYIAMMVLFVTKNSNGASKTIVEAEVMEIITRDVATLSEMCIPPELDKDAMFETLMKMDKITADEK